MEKLGQVPVPNMTRALAENIELDSILPHLHSSFPPKNFTLNEALTTNSTTPAGVVISVN